MRRHEESYDGKNVHAREISREKTQQKEPRSGVTKPHCHHRLGYVKGGDQNTNGSEEGRGRALEEKTIKTDRPWDAEEVYLRSAGLHTLRKTSKSRRGSDRERKRFQKRASQEGLPTLGNVCPGMAQEAHVGTVLNREC